MTTSSNHLTSHLGELRHRLMFATATWITASIICYILKDTIFTFLAAPLSAALGNNQQLIYTGLHDMFFTYVKLSLWCGLFIALPILLWELWRFIAPGLYEKERKFALPFLIATPFLFYAGGIFSYYIILPIVIKFFLSFQSAGISALPAANTYLSLFIKMTFAFGLAFELPIALLVMLKFGIITIKQLQHFRRYAIVIIAIASALLTPPDPASQLLLALPMALLYELAIHLGKALYPQKPNDEAKPE